MTDSDVVDRLSIDPGKRTFGELFQDRERALQEIKRLRSELERLRAMRAMKNKEQEPSKLPAPQYAFRPGTLIRLGEVCQVVGVCRSTVYRWMSEGTFPEPVRIGEKAVRWRIDDVERWRESL